MDVYKEMLSFCRSNPTNKRTLLRWRRAGFYVALAAAIQSKPTKDDDELILAIDAKTLPKGFAQHAMLTAILKLDQNGHIARGRRNSVVAWAEQMTDLDAPVKTQIAKLKSGSI